MVAAFELLFLESFARERFDDADAGKCLLHRHYHLGHPCLLVLHCFLGATAVNAQWQQTRWKEDQRHNSEFPIHQKEHSDCTDDGDRLFKNVAANAGQSHLHDAGIISDARHQKSRPHLVKEIHGMANHLAKKLDAYVGDHPVAHPLHAIGASVGTEAAHGHDGRDGQTDENNRIDLRACVQNVKIRTHRHRIGSSAVENRAGDPGNR